MKPSPLINRGLLTLILVIAIVTLLVSCSAGKLLVVNTLARAGDYQLQADLAYGPDPRQRLDVYFPAKAQQTAIPSTAVTPLTIVFIPGGCWGACETYPKEDYRFIADTLSAEGYVVVILNYRLFPQYRFGEIQADVTAAINYLVKQQDIHQIPADAIVLMGHSAGAHLAALTVLDSRHVSSETRHRLRGWIGLAGPYDFFPFSKDYQAELFGPEENFPNSQPINFVSNDNPPALLLYGKDDDSVRPRNILSLGQRFLEVDVSMQVRCYDGIDHGGIVAALSRPLRERYPVLPDILTFLDQLREGNIVSDTELPVCTR